MYYMKRETENRIKNISEVLNTSHGSAYDRGGADAWYARARNPHKRGETDFTSIYVLTEQEIEEYHFGYDTSDFNGKGY